MSNPDVNKVTVSVVIVSWNVSALLAASLASVEQHKGNVTTEVIVVDNRSADDTLTMLARQFPYVTVIANEDNVGFARANNQGFAVAKGESVLILNPDTQLTPEALPQMVNCIRDKPQVGAVGPRIIYPDGRVQSSCARKLPTLSAALLCRALRLDQLPFLGHFFARLQHPYDYGVSRPVEAMSGAAMLVRRNVLQEVGSFGTGFLHGGEDLDLCRKIGLTGRALWYLPTATIIHHKGQSSKQAAVRTTVSNALSTQHYFVQTGGTGRGTLFRLIYQGVQTPLMLLTGVIKVLLRRESTSTFKRRLLMAWAIWQWAQ